MPSSPFAPRSSRASEAPPLSSWRKPRWGWPVAAVVGVLGVVALVYRTERDHVARADQAGAPVHMVVPAGAPARTFPLADGSRVTLAPGSTLESRGAFGGAARTLEVHGEAVFTVAPGEVPFVVLASGVRVEDVSTAFLVRSLPVRARGRAVPAVLVTVTQGRVQVSTPSFAAAVDEGYGMVVDSLGAHLAVEHDAALKSVAWTGGALLFEDESLPSAVERLERWTGLHIVLDSALTGSRLTTAIEGGTPAGMLQQVAMAVHGQVVARGDHWELRPH